MIIAYFLRAFLQVKSTNCILIFILDWIEPIEAFLTKLTCVGIGAYTLLIRNLGQSIRVTFRLGSLICLRSKAVASFQLERL